MAIFGLVSSQSLDGKQSLNARRKVFYQYPNGAAPLMGLLSMMDEESSDKAEFGWEEERALTFCQVTAQANSAGPFTDTSGSAGAVGTDLTAAGWSKSAGDTIRVKLADLEVIQERDAIQFRHVPGTSSSFKTFNGIVTAVYTAHNTIDVMLSEAVANALNNTTANGINVIMVGSAVAEGERSKTGFQTWPMDVSNYTQIHRHAFNFSRTALKAGLKFDSSGVYKTKAKKNQLKHMYALERAAMFGVRSKTTGLTNADGETTVRRTSGGLLWFLKQWEKGNTTNGGAFDYRPSGSDISTSDWKTTDDKRVIDVNGTCSKDEFELLIERVFKYTSDGSFEKLCLCGGGIISAFNKFVDREALRCTKLSVKETYGMDLVTWESPHGTIHFKSHPLLTQAPGMNNSGFIIDMGNLVYTPLNDSDTNLLKNRQSNDYDGRKDEWLTECGLEIRFPESHMFIDRLTGITS